MPSGTERAEDIIRDLESRRDSLCPDCRAPLCGHKVLVSWVLGYKNAPRCVECLAAALGLDALKMRESAVAYIAARECYLEGWKWATRREGVNCMTTDLPPAADASWDAGDMGCGDLVLELRVRLQAIQAGQVLKVRATDPGAPEDMPAWCRMTENPLILARHPDYWIQKKG